MGKIIEKTEMYTISELPLDCGGNLIDKTYKIEYVDTPKEDKYKTLAEAYALIKKHFKSESNKIANIIVIAFIFMLNACVSVQKEVFNLPDLDESYAKTLMKDGKNTIVGSAFLKQLDGHIQSCAGSVVELIPATDYAKSRMHKLYAMDQRGLYSPTNKHLKFISQKDTDEANYIDLRKRTVCDIDGKFEFENVHDGSFFALTTVTWQYVVNKYGNMATAGGSIMLPVIVKNGQTKKIVVTR